MWRATGNSLGDNDFQHTPKRIIGIIFRSSYASFGLTPRRRHRPPFRDAVIQHVLVDSGLALARRQKRQASPSRWRH